MRTHETRFAQFLRENPGRIRGIGRFWPWHFNCKQLFRRLMAQAHASAKFNQNQKQSEHKMKKLSQLLTVAGVASALLLSAGNLVAQDPPPGGGQGGDRGGRGRGGPGGGNFDPAEMQQRMMTNIREQFGVKDDAEWKILEARVQKVMDARREVGVGGGGMGRMFRRPGGDNGGGGGGGRRGGGGFFGGEPDPTQEALDKAIESKASKEDLKAAMAKVRASKKEKESKLAAAQEELKKVLSTQQEATALSMGLVQ